ncbi:MAG: hypothetical protein RLZZ373_3247 [Pseudomonadota bacterium]|jgi:prophage antirepressor-like protein
MGFLRSAASSFTRQEPGHIGRGVILSNLTTPSRGASTRTFTFHLSETASFTVRAILDDAGDPWFVAADVCHALSIENSRDAVSRLDLDDVGTTDIIDSMGRRQSATTINESGLYSLILVSRKPEAKPFKRWVTSEVLPAIRKTGRYQQIATPVELSRIEILRLAMESEEAKLKAEAERDEAIRTKAMIGSKREATAMNTAARATREAERLREELGASQRHATVAAVERALKKTLDWVPLRRWCKVAGLSAVEVPDARFGTVKAWPAAAWKAVYGVDLPGMFGKSAG